MNETLTGDKTADVVATRIAEQLSIAASDVKPEQLLVSDLGCDELDLIEIVLSLEDEFGIEIREREGDALTTVQSAIDLVNRKLHAIATPRNPGAPA